MASNYPDDVTGNEYHIAGPDYEKESDEPCPYILRYGSECGAPTMEQGYGGERWLSCMENDHITDLEPLDSGDDPDRKRDEERDRQMTGDFDPTDTDLGHDEDTMLGR